MATETAKRAATATPRRLKAFIGGEWVDSRTTEDMPVTNSSTGEVMAETPRCTADEVNAAVEAAAAAYPAWRDTPITKRVQDFEEGIQTINSSEFANGSSIFTQSGYHAREFARRIDAGMVGVNVGIPVPISAFPFCGHKNSFFGDRHVMGRDGVAFFTETKAVTSYWFDEKDKQGDRVGTWEGTITRT